MSDDGENDLAVVVVYVGDVAVTFLLLLRLLHLHFDGKPESEDEAEDEAEERHLAEETDETRRRKMK